MLLPSSCRISLKYSVHIFTIKMVFNSYKKKILEVTYTCCTQNVENLFAYHTHLFACLQITALVYSLKTPCIIFSIHTFRFKMIQKPWYLGVHPLFAPLFHFTLWTNRQKQMLSTCFLCRSQNQNSLLALVSLGHVMLGQAL